MELPAFMTESEPAIPAPPESGLPTGAPEGFIPSFNQPAAAPEVAPVFDFSALERLTGQDPAAPVATPQSIQTPQEATQAPEPAANPYAGLDPETLEIARRIQNGEGLYGHLHQLAQDNLQQYGGDEQAVLSQLLAPDVNTVVAQVDAELQQMYEAQGAEYDPSIDPNQAVMRQMLYKQYYQEAQQSAIYQFQASQQAQARQRQELEQVFTLYPYAERNAVLAAQKSGIDPVMYAKTLHTAIAAERERITAEVRSQNHPARQAPSPLAGRAQQPQAAQGVGNLSLPPVPDGIKNPGAFAEYERQLLEASQRLRRF